MKDSQREIFELILLRKKLFIQLFNFVCILYKSKRLLKRICDAETKQEPKDTRQLRRGNKGRKLEHSTSIGKLRDLNENNALKIHLEPMNRHSSAMEGSALLKEKNLIKPPSEESPEAPHPVIPQTGQDLNSGLIAEKRPRKTSIEIIAEEREDLLEYADNFKEAANSEVNKETVSEEHDHIQSREINISDMESTFNPNLTEDIEKNLEVFPPLDEDGDQSDYLEDLQNVTQDKEAAFLDSEHFIHMKKGFISLE